MLVFGHVATATVACRGLEPRVDLRAIVFWTLVADLIDKPLGLVVFADTINNGRVWFHSLAVNLVLSAALLAWRKPPVYVLALWLHQLCDRMWMRPWVALWPLSGAFGYRDLPLDEWVYSILNPYNVISEAVGVAVLTFFVFRYRLYQADRLRALFRTGRLESPLV